MFDIILFLLIGGIVGYIYGSKKAHEERQRRRKDLLDRMVKMSQELGFI